MYSFVPAQIPRKRRLQMLAVAIWSVMIVTTSCAWLILWCVGWLCCWRGVGVAVWRSGYARVPRVAGAGADFFAASASSLQVDPTAMAVPGRVLYMVAVDRHSARARRAEQPVVAVESVLAVLRGLLSRFVSRASRGSCGALLIVYDRFLKVYELRSVEDEGLLRALGSGSAGG